MPCGLTALALVSPSTPIIARVAMAAVFAATLVDPARGLLAVAVAGPLSAYLAELFGAGDFRLVEAILVSFVAAWLLRPPAGDAGPRLPRYATTAGWLFAVLVLSVTAGVFTQLFRYPDILRATLLGLADSYFSYADSAGVTQAVRTLESLAVVAAAIALFRRRPSLANTLPAACAIAAAGAALASVLLSFGIAPYRLLARQQLLGDLRHAAHVADLNAAGSYFAMILCLSLGMTVRERGRRRLWWMASSAACVVGLWLSRSRSAEAAAALIVAAAALWSTTVAWPRTLRVRVIGGVLGVLVLLVLAAAWRIEKNPTYSELGLRQQFVMSSFRIIGTHPYFGIGPGQYYNDSPLFLTPQLAWTYGAENSHNNFLQITTEEGIVGFALFATWLAGGLSLAASALASSPRDWRLLGATAGVAVFIATWLGSHPLVVPEVSLAFFLQFALIACLGASALLNQFANARDTPASGRATPAAFWPAVGVLGTLILGVWPALTVVKPNAPVHLEEVDGFYYDWGVDEGGVSFRWTREFASVFVPASARRVELTLRAPAGTPADRPVRVDIRARGVMRAPVLVGDAWKTVTVDLLPSQPPLTFNRINLRSYSVAEVNGRPVGVRVGEVRISGIAWEVVAAGDKPSQP